ncbi:hypothetical protein MRS44_014479 [Fusarium solani]|jgi:hypothetical protein|uniref:Uncharacterized protein n=1 Tax=Fusarium solani TaxID=169388 RepID=A0A9P9K0K1_FUSSL|nr:uncharacterized protein B0J15DRAFT_86466 [Fusarium solani]KAH7244707.1 hypothetical protein B0J15DRAFT_86466 [Fusarium solani]KAJ3457338.1 hypothetical protein MRS44_014479 [Fusarium solani]
MQLDHAYAPPKAGVPSAVWKSVLRSRTKASTAAHQKTPSALANSTPPFSPSGPKQLHGDYAIPARRGGQALLLMGRPALPGDGNMETGRGRTTCQRCTMHDTTAPRRLCIVSFFKPSFSCRRLLLPPPVPVFPLPPSLLSPIAPPTISSHHDAARQWSMVNGLAADMTGLAATTCSYLGTVAAREKVWFAQLRAGDRRRQHRNIQRGNLASVGFRAASRVTFHTDPPRLV